MRLHSATFAALAAVAVLTTGCKSVIGVGTTPTVPTCSSDEGSTPTPRNASDPMFVIRQLSPWEGPAAQGAGEIVYAGGAVAILVRDGDSGFAGRSGITPATPPESPLMQYSLGQLSACELGELTSDFEELRSADFGQTGIMDASYLTIERVTHDGSAPHRIGIESYGLDSDNLSEAEQRARDRVTAWIDRVRGAAVQRLMPIDRVVVSDRDSGSSTWKGTPVRWTGPTVDPGARCVLFTGDDAAGVVRSVRASAEANPTTQSEYRSVVFRARYLVGDETVRRQVTVIPPGVSCESMS